MANDPKESCGRVELFVDGVGEEFRPILDFTLGRS